MSIALTRDHWEVICDCSKTVATDNGHLEKIPCGSMFWRCNPPMTEKEFREDILSRGWTIDKATGRCFCPRPNTLAHWKDQAVSL